MLMGRKDSELSQTQKKKKKKNKYHTNLHLYVTLKTNKNALWIQRRDGDGGTGWEVGQYKTSKL